MRIYICKTTLSGKAAREASHRFLLAVLKDSFDISPTPDDFARGDKGKPYLPGYANIHFNLSHTEGLFAAATAKEPLGIDCEAITRPVRAKALSKRFFAPSEQEYLTKNDFSPEIFFLIWTKKESYIKYLGEGLSIPLPSFCTPPGYALAPCSEAAYQAAYRVGDHIVSVTQKNAAGFAKKSELISINLSDLS